jgi:hypothetical protein
VKNIIHSDTAADRCRVRLAARSAHSVCRTPPMLQ